MKNFTHEGVHYKNIHEFCKKYGYNYTRLYGLHYTNDKLSMSELLNLYHTKKKNIVHNGVSYKTYTELCDKNSINTSLFKNKLKLYKDTHTLDEIVEMCKRLINYNGKNYTTITKLCAGLNLNIAYFYKIMAKNKGLDISSLIDIYHNTVDDKKERQSYVERKDSIKISYLGVNYSSLGQFCKENNFNYSRFNSTYKENKDKDIEDLVKHFTHEESQRRPIVYKEKTYKGLKSLCRELNISYPTCILTQNSNPDITIEDLVNGVKKTNQKGFNDEKTGKVNRVTYKGVEYNNAKLLCDTLGVNYLTYKYRKRKHFNRGINYWVTGEKPTIGDTND